MTEAGLYLHVPFCLRRCAYCGFYALAEPGRLPRYVSALCAELRLRSEPHLPVDTVYLGGGTPSLLAPEQVRRVLDEARACFALEPDAEITIEANPGTVDASRLEGYRAAGVNRLVLGVQSLSDDDLRFLGRLHDVAGAVRSAGLAREAGFDNLGLDLIYGLPGRDEAHWREQLARAADLEPDHLSCYNLTFEEDTPLESDRRTGRFLPPSEDQERRLFLLTLEESERLGFSMYEVSNFARRPSARCRHNLKYWSFEPYLGFGPSAHSFTAPVRSWNDPDLGAYLRSLEASTYPPGDWEDLAAGQRALEALLLGLRTARGVDLLHLERSHAPGFRRRNEAVIERLVRSRLATLSGHRLRLTPEGLAVGDHLPLHFEV